MEGKAGREAGIERGWDWKDLELSNTTLERTNRTGWLCIIITTTAEMPLLSSPLLSYPSRSEGSRLTAVADLKSPILELRHPSSNPDERTPTGLGEPHLHSPHPSLPLSPFSPPPTHHLQQNPTPCYSDALEASMLI